LIFSSFEKNVFRVVKFYTHPKTNIWIIQIVVSLNVGIPKWMVYNGKPYQNG